MNRRTFLKASCGISGLMVCRYPLIAANGKDKATIRFGMLTDVHYANRNNAGSRSYRQSMNNLNEAINVFNHSDLNFVIELGDFKDQGENPNREQTLSFLDEIEREYRKFNGDRYHALGNHNMDSLTKADFLAHAENSGKANGKNCYSFVQKGIKFIVLDANYNEDRSDYDRGNFDWTKAFVPDRQKVWLEQELNTKRPAVVFVHQMLDSFAMDDKRLCIGNAPDIVEILERKNNVLAVFQGHHHAGHYSFRNGIHYFTLKGMIEGAFPENNSYAIVEIDKSLNISIDGFHNCEDKYLKKHSF
jgi:alkaline phosphatase